jgi:signal transduction histidine kinase
MTPRVFLLLLTLVTLSTQTLRAWAEAPPYPTANHGVLDLRGWNFERDGPVPLAGAWRLHWGRLTKPGDLLPADRFVTLPGSWAQLPQANGQAFGAGTLRLRLLLPPDAPPLALLTPEWHAAFRLWIDDQIATAVGTPGLSADSEHARAQTATLPVPLGQTSMGLTLQISNFFHYDGGPNQPILIGLAQTVARPAQMERAVNLMVLGGCMVLGLWHITLIILRREKAGDTVFGALTVVLTVMVACFTNLHFFLFPGLGQQLGMRLEYVGIIGVSALFPAVAYRLFPANYSRLPVRIHNGAAILAGVFVVATPPQIFSFGRVGLAVLAIAGLALMLLSALPPWLAERRGTGSGPRNDGARILVLTLAAVIPCVGNDILYAFNYVNSVPTSGVALLILAVGLQMVMSLRNAHAAEAVERLSDELATLNQALEARVAARTAALEAVDRQRTRLFSVIAHDLRGPFNTLMGLSEAMLVLAEQWNRDRLLDMTGRLHQAASQVHALLDTLLEWARLHMSTTAPSPVSFALDTVAQRVGSSLNAQAVQKGITLGVKAMANSQVTGDTRMTEIILRNLVGNALKFTRPGGRVTVTVERHAHQVLLQVQDTGIGIAPKRLAALLSGEDQTSTPGTRGEPGTGLGLMLCRELAEKQGASLDAQSTPNVGTTFSVTFPPPTPAPATS